MSTLSPLPSTSTFQLFTSPSSCPPFLRLLPSESCVNQLLRKFSSCMPPLWVKLSCLPTFFLGRYATSLFLCRETSDFKFLSQPLKLFPSHSSLFPFDFPSFRTSVWHPYLFEFEDYVRHFPYSFVSFFSGLQRFISFGPRRHSA